MIDLHCHLLPGIDDGASNVSVSLEMARMCVDQGVVCVACTPHILPGLYNNAGPQIWAAVDALQSHISDAGIELELVPGADNHVVPDFVSGLRSGHLLCLGASRYVLVEPPHHVAPPHLDRLFTDILAAEYIPILTHPERLSWIEDNYVSILEMARLGVWMQITSGSLIGRFGTRRKYWAERMLSEGLVQILASDAHDTKRRPPDLARGRQAAEHFVGAQEATNLVVARPKGILLDRSPNDISLPRPAGAERVGCGAKDERDEPGLGSGGGFFRRVRNLFGS